MKCPTSPLSAPSYPYQDKPLRFGSREIPPAPEHVPAKFKKAWATLPPCCRNFYLSPGKGCCAGLPEPNPGAMATDTPQKTAKPSSQHTVKKLTLMDRSRHIILSTADWFQYFIQGFLKDVTVIVSLLKRLIPGIHPKKHT